MQAVFGFQKNRFAVRLKNLFAHLLAPVRGQAVQQYSTLCGVAHQRVINAKTRKIPQPFSVLALLPHTRPNIRRHYIRAANRLTRVVADHDFRAACSRKRLREFDPFWRKRVACGGGDSQFNTQLGSHHQTAICHIVAVTNPRYDRVCDPQLKNRHKIRHQLNGVKIVAQTVDHRHAAKARKLLKPLVRKGADHHHIRHSADHPRRVLHWLAAPQLNVARGQKQRVHSELYRADLKAHTGARRTFFKDHRKGFCPQFGLLCAAFERRRQRENLQNFLFCIVF